MNNTFAFIPGQDIGLILCLIFKMQLKKCVIILFKYEMFSFQF